MLTVNALRAWGANVDEALVRCLNNENFYVMLVGKAIKDPQFEKLKEKRFWSREGGWQNSCNPGSRKIRRTGQWMRMVFSLSGGTFRGILTKESYGRKEESVFRASEAEQTSDGGGRHGTA